MSTVLPTSTHLPFSAPRLFCTQLTAPGPVHRWKMGKCFALRGSFTMAASMSAMKDSGRNTHTQKSHCWFWAAITWQWPCFLQREKEALLPCYPSSSKRFSKGTRDKVKSEVGPGEVAALPFHHMDYHSSYIREHSVLRSTCRGSSSLGSAKVCWTDVLLLHFFPCSFVTPFPAFSKYLEGLFPSIFHQNLIKITLWEMTCIPPSWNKDEKKGYSTCCLAWGHIYC